MNEIEQLQRDVEELKKNQLSLLGFIERLNLNTGKLAQLLQDLSIALGKGIK